MIKIFIADDRRSSAGRQIVAVDDLLVAGERRRDVKRWNVCRS